MRSRGVAIVLALVLAAGAGGGAWWWKHTQAQRAQDKAARALVDALAAGWSKRDLTTPPVAFTSPKVRDTFKATFSGLGAGAKATVKVGAWSRSSDAATGNLDVSWQLTPTQKWTYTVPVSAAYDGTKWAITTSPDTSPWVPGIKATDTVSLKRVWGTRGDLLDDAGQPLMPLGNVYAVALDPVRATPATASALEQITGMTKGSLVAKLDAATKAGAKGPIPVITYRQSDFDARSQQLDALKGVIYPRTQQPLAPTRSFGQPVLGSFGEVTAETITKGNGRYAVGDRAGLSGLQGQYDATLGGTPGLQVLSSTGKSLLDVPAVDGTDVKTSLRPAIETAAQTAVATANGTPAAIVAIDVPTGNVVAIADNPTIGYDRATTGQYPPGSTFKIVTSYALLTGGKVTPETTVSCPKNVVVDGRSFHNFEGEEFGNPTFNLNFAHSCNTAFIQMAEKLGDGDLSAAAKAFGVGGDWAKGFGVNGAYAGQVPTANSQTDKVAAAIGQARDLKSPVGMASVAASIARGSFVPPALVQSAGADRTASPLDAKAVDEIRTMMRLVVTTGTGTALKAVAGAPVYGKTGTAEFGSGASGSNRVWFVGYQGDLAFAVMVEGGASGGAVAAPIAASFLDALNK
jgi:cell division protein FtsI/penicillin-binding protein 2